MSLNFETFGEQFFFTQTTFTLGRCTPPNTQKCENTYKHEILLEKALKTSV